MTERRAAIRLAAFDDVPRLIELGEQFYDGDGVRTANPAELAQFAVSHIYDAHRVCLVAGEPIAAVLCGLVTPHYFTGELTAFKTAWYAVPAARGHGAHLLRAFEKWAKEKGARRLIVAGRESRTLQLLERLDYRLLETVFAKDIPWQKPHSPSP
jgi:GNAT superfamily N-acetyltransferase